MATDGIATDHANVDLAKFHLDAVRGHAGGRVIWQPRIGCWYHDKKFAGQPLPDPYEGMSVPEVFRSLGVSARIYEFNTCFVSHEDPRVQMHEKRLNDTDIEQMWETPAGTQRAVRRQSPNSPYRKHLKWPIADEKDMRIALWREGRRTWTWDPAAYERVGATWAGLGAPTAYLPRTTAQKLYIEDMGVEAAIFALADYGDTCEAYFEALNRSHERLIEVVNASPIEIINFGDNVHSATLPPRMFELYLLPAYRRRTELLHAAGKFVHSHWDGDCGPLLSLARDTGLDGIEAITPAPQGDVTLEQVREALGDMWLIDGIPAIYFDETFPEQTLLDCVRRLLDLFAPNLILGISDEISSTGEIERIRRVTEVVDEYNATR